MNANHIIESCTKQSSEGGYTSYPALCVLYENRIRELCAELNELNGLGQTPARGCGFHESYFGAADVLIEYEYEGASGDGWNEPYCEAQITIARVFLNGKWCDAEDVSSEADRIRWENEIWSERAEVRETAAEDAAEARAEMRRDNEVLDREWVTL